MYQRKIMTKQETRLHLSILPSKFIYFLSVFFFFSSSNTTDSSLKSDNLAICEPIFEPSISLFKERNLGFLAQELCPELPKQIITWLYTNEAREILHQISGDPNKREIGHQEHRKEVYSGVLVQPYSIVLTNSGKTTLAETIESLQKNKTAHNFIIDRDGKIYPITKEHESIEEALTHRPFALGISAAILDGFTQCRDMNSYSISISLVGPDTEPHTQEQIQSLIQLVSWLSEKFSINKRNVRVYGAIAYPYSTPQNPIHGRRSISPYTPLKELAAAGLALWPDDQYDAAIYSFLELIPTKYPHFNTTLWASLALQKIGFLCPSTKTSNHPDFKAALRKFQYLYLCDNQEALLTPKTIAMINSILLQSEENDPQLLLIAPEGIVDNSFYKEWLENEISMQENSINHSCDSNIGSAISSCDNSDSITKL